MRVSVTAAGLLLLMSGAATAAELNTLKDLGAALNACWTPPPMAKSHPGMEITVQVTFKRSGELLGKPRVTFESRTATDEHRLAYRIAMVDSIERCTPLPLSESLGGAIAGRPFRWRVKDLRHEKQT